MRIASRVDTEVQKFIKLAGIIGTENIQIMFGRRLYCDIVNEPSHPQNQIFLLRPAQKVELERFDFRLTNDREALTELQNLAKIIFPQVVANFRIVSIETQPSQVFLLNMQGEKSSMRPIDFFFPKSLATLRVHCLSVGNFVWCGSYRVVRPFHDFCLKESVTPE